MANYERAIFQLDIEPSYGFLDDPEWDVDLHRDECLFILQTDDMVGYHACVHSAYWEDISGYVDRLQEEEKLPEGNYIVTYYIYDGQDLQQRAEIGVTKAQIIQNVLDQKYVEGAEYFLKKEDEFI